MMKLFIILILLPLVFSDISKEEFVKRLNEKRLKLAERENIPNMNEMVWDDEIASRMGSMDNNSEEYRQFIYVSSYETRLSTPRGPKTRSWNYGTFSFFNPSQTHFGCVSFGSGEYDSYLMCLCKPRAGMFEKKGEPGSDCKEGFENHGGLCRRVGEGSTTTVETSVPSEVSKFVQKVNEKRLELAKRESIPNMNEMFWDDEIASRIGGFDENSEEWKLLDNIKSYEDGIQELDSDLSSATRFSKYETFVFLNPTQTHFGCGLSDNVLKCLSKPRFAMFEKEGEAGSDCNEGFENHGGLCRRLPETTTTEEMTTIHPTTDVTTLKKIPDEKEKKKEETENNSSSFDLFSVFVLVLWIFID